MNQDSQEQWEALFSGALNGTLDDSQAQQLAEVLRDRAEARQLWILYCDNEAGLGELKPAASSRVALRPDARGAPWVLFRAAAAALVLLALGAGWQLQSRPRVLAEVIETQAARWEGSTLPTEPGSRIGAGTMRLAEGLARLRFRRGVEVTLEAPAELELLGAQLCRLHRGSLLAHVPEPARGFSVLTPSTRVIDHGTDFAISTDERGHGSVQVMRGEVELRHASGSPPLRLTTREMAELAPDKLHPARPMEAEPRKMDSGATATRYAAEINTRTGQGAAAYVAEPRALGNRSETLLLLKNCAEPGYGRKALLRFDLRSLPDAEAINEASLILQLGPTGLGYASHGGVARIAVYALLTDSADLWEPAKLTWNTQPAFHADPGRVDETQAQRVGEFLVPRGVQSGTFTLGGPGLTATVKGDSNRLLTLVLLRENRIEEGGGLVLGIAGNAHPLLAPPTLRVR